MKVTSRSGSVERIRGDAKDAKIALPVIDKSKKLSVADLMNKTLRCRSKSSVTGAAQSTLLVKGEGMFSFISPLLSFFPLFVFRWPLVP